MTLQLTRLFIIALTTVVCRYAEADAMYAESAPIVKRAYGPKHELTLSMISDHARCVAQIGMSREGRVRLAEAEEMLVETLAVQKRVLGAMHETTIRTTRTLADTRKAVALHKKTASKKA